MEIPVIFTNESNSKTALQVIQKLGTGKFSVYLAHSPVHNTNFAVKIFPRNTFGTTQYKNETLNSSFNHINVAQYIPVESHHNTFYATVTEYAQYGNFFDLVTSEVFNTDTLVRTYFHQLIEGLEHIHSQGVAHMDLKLGNLMLGSDFMLKVIDFDQAQRSQIKTTNSKGSEGFRAPEIIEGTCQDPVSADIYSAGIILYALKAQEFPFLEVQDENNKDVWCYARFVKENKKFWKKKKIDQSEDDFFSKGFMELINGMLHRDPKQRLRIKDIKKSKWYKGETLNNQDLKIVMKAQLKSMKKN